MATPYASDAWEISVTRIKDFFVFDVVDLQVAPTKGTESHKAMFWGYVIPKAKGRC